MATSQWVNGSKKRLARFGVFELDLDARELRKQGVRLQLQPKPLQMLAILLERESTLRQQKRFESRAKAAKLRHLAAVEDVDYRTPRGLDRAMFMKLTSCDWISASGARSTVPTR